jgi:hypothetical protein
LLYLPVKTSATDKKLYYMIVCRQGWDMKGEREMAAIGLVKSFSAILKLL